MKYFLSVMAFHLYLYGTTLDGLIHYAMENSTVIKQSKAQIELSEVQREENQAAQLGNIDLVGSYTHYNLPRTLIPLTPGSLLSDPDAAKAIATTKDFFGTGVKYSVPLFTGFSQTRQVEMDDMATQLSRSKLSLTKEQLAYNVASLYLSVLALQDMHAAQQKHVAALKKLKDIIAKEVTFGKKAEIDLLKAESDFFGNRSYLEVLKGNIAMTKASLASLVGLEHIGTIKPVKVSVKKPQYSMRSLVNEASKLNKVHISDLNIQKARKGIEKSESSLYPQVSLDSYYGYNYGNNDNSNAFPGQFNAEENWQIGVSAKWTLYDFGKSHAGTEKAKILRMQATFDKEQTLLDLRKSLVEAVEKMKQEYANYKANLKQLALAKKSEKIERVRYKNGVSTINDLLYATSQTHVASAKLIESKYNYQKGKFYMNYLLEKGVK
ncbi:MAG TPA: TolC family protein [Sulfurovum sp.]|nr:TolC family protein [Sulfurovum sp.]